jgi:hypothetical protein
MPIGDIAALPAEQLVLLQEEINEHLDRAKTLKDWFDGALGLRYTDRAVMARVEAGKDTGTVRFGDGDVTVVADLPKRVEWDQARLSELVDRILAGGDDPSQYVDLAFKVPERKYSAWPEHLRTAFAPARTVRSGKPSFDLRLNESA